MPPVPEVLVLRVTSSFPLSRADRPLHIQSRGALEKSPSFATTVAFLQQFLLKHWDDKFTKCLEARSCREHGQWMKLVLKDAIQFLECLHVEELSAASTEILHLKWDALQAYLDKLEEKYAIVKDKATKRATVRMKMRTFDR
eukprot:996472-Amphidinium_carterae.1